MKYLLLSLCLVGAISLEASAHPVPVPQPDPPTSTIGPDNPVSSFSRAKKLARDTIYADHRKTLYCGCDFVPNARGTGGKIGTRAGLFDASGCGYTVRKSELRGRRLEWEHIVPASLYGGQLSCWKDGHADCTTSAGKPYKGRSCCAKVSKWFEHGEADLHNLAPAVGELNGDRSNHLYGHLAPFIEAEETSTPDAEAKHRLYGKCNFEVAGPSPREAEPEPDIRGDVARVWFYMARAYNMSMPRKAFDMFKAWHEEDPVNAAENDWELTRDSRIKAIQGNVNPYVHGLDVVPEDFQIEE